MCLKLCNFMIDILELCRFNSIATFKSIKREHFVSDYYTLIDQILSA